jgi:hypothetical protein
VFDNHNVYGTSNDSGGNSSFTGNLSDTAVSGLNAVDSGGSLDGAGSLTPGTIAPNTLSSDTPLHSAGPYVGTGIMKTYSMAQLNVLLQKPALIDVRRVSPAPSLTNDIPALALLPVFSQLDTVSDWFDPFVPAEKKIFATSLMGVVAVGVIVSTAARAGAAAMADRVGSSLGPKTVGAAQRIIGKVVQTGGNKIRKSTADALNKATGSSLTPREWGRGLEALKKDFDLANSHHGKITEYGHYLDETGKWLGNILEYL